MLLLARLGDDADLLDAGVDRLFADDLDDGLGQPVAIDQRKHFLLHRGGGGVLPRPATRRGDDRFANFGHKCGSIADIVIGPKFLGTLPPAFRYALIIEKISMRKGEMTDMRPTGAGKTRIVFHGPARGLIGYHGEFLTDTRGTGVMNRMFLDYAPHKGSVGGRTNGVLISTEQGEAVTYGLWYIEERGKLFITTGAKVYEGMIIGQNAKDNDLDVNPLKSKQLTNIRTTSKDEAVKLTPIVPMTLEQAMAYIEDDELVEVTPQNIRLRKRALLPHLRKRAKQAAEV